MKALSARAGPFRDQPFTVTTSAQDRRQYPRTRTRLPALFSEKRPGPRFVARGAAENLGPNGLLLRAGPAFGFHRGMTLEIQLLVPSSVGHWPYPGQVHCTGRVLRTEEQEPGQLAVAVQLDPEMRLHFPSVV